MTPKELREMAENKALDIGTALNAIASAADRIETLEYELAFAREGLNAVSALIDESHGVGGLHLNGDFAPWSELRTGGRFETWLAQFDASLNAARTSNQAVEGRTAKG